MVACKDCIHNNVCSIWRAQEGQDAKCWSENDDWGCDYFEDKSKIIKLPCEIGSKIYMLVTKRPKIYLPEFTFVKETYLTYTNLERVLADYGKEIFLVREEAEKALADKIEVQKHE